MIKVFELDQLACKFERHLTSEIVDFQSLSDDYSKIAIICEDRSVMFHAKFGHYYKTRTPKVGRSIAYADNTCDLLVAGSAPEVYRMNLEQGRYLAPLPSKSPAINCIEVAAAHGMLACAGEDGILECFDLRARSSIGSIDATAAAGGGVEELTALRFEPGGMQLAVGTSGGLVALFDLRSSRPLLVKDHMYGEKIVDVHFHTSSAVGGGSARRVISADTKIVKVWDATSGDAYTSIEPEGGGISQALLQGDSCVVHHKPQTRNPTSSLNLSPMVS